MNGRLLAALAVAGLWSALASWVQAQNERPARPKPAAIVDPAEAGADYALQGEYAGWTRTSRGGYEYAGLQVVALGDGKFDAVQYRGGLPGNGWDGGTKQAAHGTAEGGVLTLTGENRTIAVDGNAAVLHDAAGNVLGRLPKVIRSSPTLSLAPPPGAVVLFAGGESDELEGEKLTSDGHLLAGVTTTMPVGGFRMHLEFRTPFMPAARGQARANSGVYIQQRYEVQILDSFGLEGIENECGALYRQRRPEMNLCLPPLTWQTYDIWFTPPVFAEDGKTKLTNARISVLHNNYPIHWNREIIAKTGGGKPEGPEPLPIVLQDHGNPVVYRNVWLVPHEPSPPPATPPSAALSKAGFYGHVQSPALPMPGPPTTYGVAPAAAYEPLPIAPHPAMAWIERMQMRARGQ